MCGGLCRRSRSGDVRAAQRRAISNTVPSASCCNHSHSNWPSTVHRGLAQASRARLSALPWQRPSRSWARRTSQSACSTMSKPPRHAPLRRAGLALAAAAGLTLLLLSQRGLVISSAPSAVGERCSLAGAAATTAAAAADDQAGGGAAAALPAPPTAGQGSSEAPAPACDLVVVPSQWADSCMLLRDACVDQGSIILYGEEHRMSDSSPGMAPYFIVPAPRQREQGVGACLHAAC